MGWERPIWWHLMGIAPNYMAASRNSRKKGTGRGKGTGAELQQLEAACCIIYKPQEKSYS